MFTSKKIGIAVGIVIIILVILWYFQSQGFIKVFPTSEERDVKKILQIDESKFSPAEGLPEEAYQAKIDSLYAQKDVVIETPEDSSQWMLFGNIKEFLNDHEGAIRAWEKVLELQPLNFAAAHNIATNYQYFLKDFLKAENYYLMALDLRPDYTPAYQGLMDLYLFNLKEKQDMFEPTMLMAIETDVSNAASYYSALTNFFIDQEDFVKAKNYLSRLETLKPDSAEEFRQNYLELR